MTRVVGLDGLRGFLTLLVVVAHFFGELPNGIGALSYGWVAVFVFFTLSGFLIGGIILDNRETSRFFSTFYVRRCCRILPPYFLTVLLVYALLWGFNTAWAPDPEFPLWAYLTFSQGGFMAAEGGWGPLWLTPTWTLGVEEHFYLLAPLCLAFAPKKWIVPGLVAVIAAATLFRVAIYYFDFANHQTAMLLPGRADALALGVLTAVGTRSSIRWSQYTPALRTCFYVCLIIGVGFLRALGGYPLFATLVPLLVGIGAAALILSIVASGNAFYETRALRFLGRSSYCTYLIHLPVLSVVHGVVLGAVPDIATAQQWMVTLASIPIALAAGWAMTKYIEEPIVAYGRTWKWDASPRLAPAV